MRTRERTRREGWPSQPSRGGATRQGDDDPACKRERKAAPQEQVESRGASTCFAAIDFGRSPRSASFPPREAPPFRLSDLFSSKRKRDTPTWTRFPTCSRLEKDSPAPRQEKLGRSDVIGKERGNFSKRRSDPHLPLLCCCFLSSLFFSSLVFSSLSPLSLSCFLFFLAPHSSSFFAKKDGSCREKIKQ